MTKEVIMPCSITSLNSLRPGTGEVIHVRLLIPGNPGYRLVAKKDLTIKEQPPQCPLEAELRSPVVSDFGESLLVEVGDRNYHTFLIEVPKKWLEEKRKKKA
jgi:hypothetical protein